ncbi:MAG: DegT/DnrJ/EryC1/StrS family aminotransferase, partial [Armatimonadota bacterium]
TKHVYHQYTIRIPGGKRDEVQKKLGENGVGSFVYYPVPVNKPPVYSNLKTADLSNSDRCTTEVLSLPIWPKMSEETQKAVVEQLKAALGIMHSS